MEELTGVRAIMKDIVRTLSEAPGESFCNLSAGNPLIIPEVDQLWRDLTAELLASKRFSTIVGRYGSSKGYEPFIEAVLNDYNLRYNLKLTPKNILVSAGSQVIYFMAANSYCGYTTDGQLRSLLLPIVPEYTGYGGVCLFPEVVSGVKPVIESNATKHSFKYRLDRGSLKVDDSVGCIFLSRPCNPTGNIMSDEEVKFLVELARPKSVPIFFDSAYGTPYPALNFTEMTPYFGEGLVHCVTLSKAGLPGERVGFALGDEAIIETLEGFQTTSSIHSSRLGQALAAEAISSGRLADVCLNFVRPFYQKRLKHLSDCAERLLPADCPWFMHRGEGSIFTWLWFKDLPITDWELYQRLKERRIIVVPGSTFFPGLKDPSWKHQSECLRLSLTASEEEIETALKILGEILRELYRRG
jgi:valine--pyruvate aminotransferase